MVGLFGSGPKRVTEREMRDIQNKLHTLDKRERADVEQLFRGDLHELGKERGVSRDEFESGMQWLRDNPDKHSLEDDDLEKVERHFNHHLKD